jgi:hypothetical protein
MLMKRAADEPSTDTSMPAAPANSGGCGCSDADAPQLSRMLDLHFQRAASPGCPLHATRASTDSMKARAEAFLIAAASLRIGKTGKISHSSRGSSSVLDTLRSTIDASKHSPGFRNARGGDTSCFVARHQPGKRKRRSTSVGRATSEGNEHDALETCQARDSPTHHQAQAARSRSASCCCSRCSLLSRAKGTQVPLRTSTRGRTASTSPRKAALLPRIASQGLESSSPITRAKDVWR